MSFVKITRGKNPQFSKITSSALDDKKKIKGSYFAMNELEEKLGGKSEMKFPIGRDSGFLYLLFF